MMWVHDPQSGAQFSYSIQVVVRVVFILTPDRALTAALLFEQMYTSLLLDKSKFPFSALQDGDDNNLENRCMTLQSEKSVDPVITAVDIEAN